MDKTIEVVLVAVVVIATAAIMLFIFTGESSNFSDFVSNAITGAEEDLEETRGTGEDSGAAYTGGSCSSNADCSGQALCSNGQCITP